MPVLSIADTKMKLELLIDTDVWIDFLRGNDQAIRFIKDLQDRLFVSAVSAAELHVCCGTHP